MQLIFMEQVKKDGEYEKLSDVMRGKRQKTEN